LGQEEQPCRPLKPKSLETNPVWECLIWQSV